MTAEFINGNSNKRRIVAMPAPTTIGFSVLAVLLFSSAATRTGTHAFSPMQHRPHRLASSSTASATTALFQSKPSATTTTPKRKSRKKSNGKSRGKKGRRFGGAPKKFASQEDVADHVSYMYLHGPNGAFRGTDDKGEESQQQQQSASNGGDGSVNRNLSHFPALVLNADYQPLSFLPLSLWNWQEAVKAVFSGKVTVVDVYPDVIIRAASLEIALPSVIALTEYVPLHHHVPAFTKRNVFLRDEYRCQYCNHQFSTRDLSLDHVHPRCMGGQLEWENTVTSCRQCNGRKGSLPISQISSVGMKLSRPPRIPSQFELAAIAGRMLPRRVHPTWKPYLGIADNAAPAATDPVLNGDEEMHDIYHDEEATTTTTASTSSR